MDPAPDVCGGNNTTLSLWCIRQKGGIPQNRCFSTRHKASLHRTGDPDLFRILATLVTRIDSGGGTTHTRSMSTPQITAVTHPGHHHGDEVLATWFLQQVFKDQITIVRSSEADVMKRADILYDCGGVCDPDAGRFDHHSGAVLPAPYEGRICGYATAGLIWRKWGVAIVRGLAASLGSPTWETAMVAKDEMEKEEIIGMVARRLDMDMVAPVDAWDQGIRPDKRGHFGFLPMQWLLSHLEFNAAVTAMGEMFLFRLRALLNGEGDAWKLRGDLMENGETEFYDTPGGILVVAGQHRVDVVAAKIMLREVLNASCLGVISPLRKGTRWALFLTQPLPTNVKIPATVEHLHNRKCFYHSQREELKCLALSAGHTGTG